MLALLLGMIAFTALLGYAAGALGVDDTQRVAQAIHITAGYGLAWLVYLVTVRVFAEEVFFRAFLTPRIGVAGSAVLFGAAHVLYGSYLEVAGAVVLGGLLAWRFKATKTLWVPFLAHAAYNIITIGSILA